MDSSSSSSSSPKNFERMVRKGKGRQKIEMKKIKKESNLQVTFSKRRFGVFKKASELCTLCGVQILMIVFSPGGKAYSFAHPNAKNLIDRVLNRNQISLLHQHNNNDNQQVVAETRPNETVQLLNMILTEQQAKQEAEKVKRANLDKIREIRERKKNWYEKDVKELDINETNILISSLQDIKKKLVSEISDYYQTYGSLSYFGESSGSVAPCQNVGLGPNLFDQTNMMDLSALKYEPNMMDDVNAFKYEPNMNYPNDGPTFGYYNNEVIIPGSDMNYMSSFNFNQN